MTKALFLVLCAIMPGLPMAAGAQEAAASDVDQAMQRYDALTRSASARCSGSTTADEILVCGRGDRDRFRLPLPDERHVEGDRRVRGEVPTASAARVRSGSCGMLSTDTCGGGLPLIGAAALVAKAAARLIDPDAE